MLDVVSTRYSRLRMLVGPAIGWLLRKGAWGIADNALMSATNFAMVVLLARALSPEDFGLYALIYTSLIFVNGMQAALVSQPHTMLGAPREGRAFARYTTDTAWCQVALATMTAAATALLALVGHAAGWQADTLLLACAPATAAWQMQEFVRRVLYTRSAVAKAFANDLVSYGGQLLLVLMLWQADALTPVIAILVLAVTSLLGVLIGLWQIRAWLDGASTWQSVRAAARENWHFGKWLLGGNLATWTSGRIYPIVAAGLVSVAATGAMKALQTILGPMNVLTFAIDPLVGPKAARIHARDGISPLRRFVCRVQLLVLATVGAYCLGVALFARPLLDLVYGPAYTGYAWLLSVMAIIYAFTAFRGPMSIALTAIGETSAIFRVRLASSIANLTFGLAAVALFGIAGIGAGLILNAIVLQAVTWHFYQRYTGERAWPPRLLRGRSGPAPARPALGGSLTHGDTAPLS